MSAETSTDIRIVLISDRQLSRAGLSLLIGNHDGMRMVGEGGAFEDASELLARENPDIVLLDMDMGGPEALDWLNEIRTTNHVARVILLSSRLDPEVCRNAVGAGAKGLVLENATPESLFKAIKKVHAGEVWLDRSVMADVIDHISNHGNNRDGARQESLTHRELEVVRLVCEGLRNRQIAERLLISESTVRHHLTSIFNKLDLEDRFQLVLHAFRHRIVQPLLLAVAFLFW